jgi:hypothetical protein
LSQKGLNFAKMFNAADCAQLRRSFEGFQFLGHSRSINGAMPNEHHPFHPIIYVRGFAATQSEIEETVADPYMGFNVGSTKARMVWTGDLKRFYFESPLVRLMSDRDYDDVFVAVATRNISCLT